jgi:hypothetical protein
MRPRLLPLLWLVVDIVGLTIVIPSLGRWCARRRACAPD